MVLMKHVTNEPCYRRIDRSFSVETLSYWNWKQIIKNKKELKQLMFKIFYY